MSDAFYESSHFLNYLTLLYGGDQLYWCTHQRISSVLFLHKIMKTFCVLHGTSGFLHLLVILVSLTCRQCVQTKHTKSKTYY